MALVNLAEKIVRDRLEQMLKTHECCKCECCCTDMLALALNNIPPMYVNTYQGELLRRVDASKQQNSVDIDIAITKAIVIVSRSPHHT